MATLFKIDGTHEEFVLPDNPPLEFLQSKVGGMIEFLRFNDGSHLMVDEEGRLKDKALNEQATVLCFFKGRPQSYPIVGDAVFFSREEMEKMEAEAEDE